MPADFVSLPLVVAGFALVAAATVLVEEGRARRLLAPKAVGAWLALAVALAVIAVIAPGGA
jgi:hypothetical protein